MSSRAALLCFLALSLLPACNGCKGKSEKAGGTTAVAARQKHKRKPPREAGAPKPVDAARWLRGVPASKATFKAGDRVWALAPLPGQSTASFGVVEIDSVQDDSTVTAVPLVRVADKLQRDDATKQPGTPAGLLTPATPIEPDKIKVGDLVIAAIPGFRATVAQVTKLKGKSAEVKYVKGDKVLDETVDYALPLAQGVAPFAYGAFLDRQAYHEILIAAVADDQAYGIDDLGNAVRTDKRNLKRLNIELKDRKKGDIVVAFDGASGADTRIDAELVPRWIYTVASGGAAKPCPFYALFDKL